MGVPLAIAEVWVPPMPVRAQRVALAMCVEPMPPDLGHGAPAAGANRRRSADIMAVRMDSKRQMSFRTVGRRRAGANDTALPGEPVPPDDCGADRAVSGMLPPPFCDDMKLVGDR